jgi:histidinol-phosphate aminotransferase
MSIADLVNPHIRELEPYEPGKPIEALERELGITGSIKLASNENPHGPSPKAVAAIRALAAGLHRYPDGASFELRRRLAGKLGVDGETLAA